MDFHALTEPEARAYLESVRWPGGVRCAFCDGLRVARVWGGRDGLYMCHICRKQFTVTVGTIFERSHIPLNKCLYAAYLLCCSKKGISALQLQRMLGLGSYKSAWHLSHRIRRAMRPKVVRPMGGVVEADETFVGGTAYNAHLGEGEPPKTPVLAVLQRGGRLHAQPIKNTKRRTLKKVLAEQVLPQASLMTDEAQAYRYLGWRFAKHDSVRHVNKQYVKGDTHINTAESFFALLKRGLMGSYHSVSPKHLHRYCDEFSFRWTFRKASDEERTKIALAWTTGKRLLYQGNHGRETLITPKA